MRLVFSSMTPRRFWKPYMKKVVYMRTMKMIAAKMPAPFSSVDALLRHLEGLQVDALLELRRRDPAEGRASRSCRCSRTWLMARSSCVIATNSETVIE